MSKWRRLQEPALDFKGTMSESYLCICGYNTAPGNLNSAEAEEEAARQMQSGKRKWKILVTHDRRSETYFVHDHVWKAAGVEDWGGCLCIRCPSLGDWQPLHEAATRAIKHLNANRP
jgi:hypothetical protein